VHLDVPITDVTLDALDAALHEFEVAYRVSDTTWHSAFCDGDCHIVESPEFYRTAALYALRGTAHPRPDPGHLAVA
jgi:hypothetical protein